MWSKNSFKKWVKNVVRKSRGEMKTTTVRNLSVRLGSGMDFLEERVVPSTIVWANRGTGAGAGDTDAFNATYGANATVARQLVDRAIQDWAETIVSFNYNTAPINTYTITILAADQGGGGRGVTYGIGLDNGKPKTGTIEMDDNGGGGGWFFDTTPLTDSEYTTTLSPFAATATTPLQNDFYRTIVHEMGHAMGITSTPGTLLAGALVARGTDQVDGSSQLNTFTSGTFVVTLTNNGGRHVYEGPVDPAFPTDPVHPLDLMNPGRTVPGNLNERQIISDTNAQLLQLAYNYTILMPSQRDTFYTTFNSTTGVVTLRGDINNGAAASDTFTISRVGADVRFQANGTSELVPFASINSIQVNGLAGNDLLTIDYSGGVLPAINYDGGTQSGTPGDTLIIQGGSFASSVYTPTGPASGTLTHVGGATGTAGLITFTGLEPVTDTTAAATFTINATAAAEIINIVNGPVAGQTQVNSGSGTFELVNFANKTAVTVNGLGGGDIINLNNPNPATGMTSLAIDAGTGVDLVTVSAIGVGVPVSVLTGAEADTVNVGPPSNFLDNIFSLITVDGQGGGDTVNVNDTANGFGDTYTLTNTAFTRNFFGGLNYSNISNLNIFAGANGHTLNINSTATGVTTTFNGGAGNDTVNIGTGNLDLIAGAVTVNGGTGTDQVNLNDSTQGAADVFTITSTTVTRTPPGFFGGLTYGAIEGLALATTGADQFDITSTDAATPVVLNIASGTTTTNINASSSLVTVNGGTGNDTVNVGSGNLDNVAAVVVNGNGGTDSVVINDTTANFNDAYTITNSTVSRIFFNLTYGTIENLTLNAQNTLGTNGNNTFDVTSTAAGVTTTINGNDGNDIFNITGAGLGAGSTNNFNGGNEPAPTGDTYNITPWANGVTVNINGNDPTPPALPGDTLNFDLLFQGVTITPTSFFVTNFPHILLSSFVNIETFNLLNVGPVTAVGDAADNVLTITSVNANSAVIGFNGGIQYSMSGIDSVNYDAGAGDDTLIVDYTGGLVTFPIAYDGQGQNSGTNGDTLTLRNYNVTQATVTHTNTVGSPNNNQGTVQIGAGSPLVSFQGLEPLALAGTAANLIINLPVAVQNANVLLADDGPANFPIDIGGNTGNTSAIGSLEAVPTFEFTQFTNPTNSLTVNLGNLGDTLRIRSLDVLFPAVTSITVNGGTGDDNMVMDYSTGAIFKPAAVGGSTFQFNGGAGDDTVGFATNNAIPPAGFPNLRETYFATGDNSGTFIVDADNSAGPGAPSGLLGADGTTVNFTGAENIESSIPAAFLDAILTVGADEASVDDSATTLGYTGILTPAGTFANQITDVGGTFSNVRFVNAAAVTLNGYSGSDILGLNYNTIAAGLTSLMVYGHVSPPIIPAATLNADDNAGDFFPVFATAPAFTVDLFGQGGNDSAGAGFFTNLGDANLDDVRGIINWDGGTGTDFMAFQDFNTAAVVGDLVTFTNNQITGLAPATINYTTTESVFLESGPNDDTWDVLSTQLGTQYMVGGDGGSDEFTIGNTTADFNAQVFDGTLAAILGQITFMPGLNGVDGVDTLNVDASGDAGPLAASITNIGIFDGITSPQFTGYGTGFGAQATQLAGFAPATINYYHNAFTNNEALEFLNVRASTGADVIAVNDTTATDTTTIDGREGDDTFNINGTNLSANNVFQGFDGNDQFNLNIVGAGNSIGTNAVYAIESVLIQGQDNLAATPGDSINRDRVTITDTSLLARNLNYLYSTPQGWVNVEAGAANAGLFGPGAGGSQPLQIRTMETLRYFDAGESNDIVAVTGTTVDDLITIAQGANNTAEVFLNGNPYLEAAPVSLATFFPGIAGGGMGVDMYLTGILPYAAGVGGIRVNGGGISGEGDRVVVQAASENAITEPANPTDIFGFGAGVLIPGFGAGNAYDTSVVTDSLITTTNNSVGALTAVQITTADFIQTSPIVATQRPAVIFNGGDEIGFSPFTGLADSITATISFNFNIQVNGNLPNPVPPGVPPFPVAPFLPNGDALFVNILGAGNVFSDANAPPNVSVTQSLVPVPFGIRFSSIERATFESSIGVINIIGDNNDAGTTQDDGFRIVGMDVDGDGSGQNEFSLQISGNAPGGETFYSAPLFFRGVNRLNVIGGNSTGFNAGADVIPNNVDTGMDLLEITPYATSTWPWDIFINTDLGDNVDSMVYTGVAGLQDDTHILATGMGAGRVNALGIGSGTTNQVLRFLGTENVTYIANPGDGDSLTLDLTSRPDTAVVSFDPAAGVNDVVLSNDLGALFNVEVDQANTVELTINGAAGNDTVNVNLAGAQTLPMPLNFNGGTTTAGGSDVLILTGNAGTDDFTNTAGTNSGEGTAEIGGVDSALISYTGLERIDYVGNGGADTLTVTGTSGADSFEITATPASNDGTGTASGQPAFTFTGFGAGSSLTLNGLGGDDLFSLYLADDWGIADVTVNGGAPTASDTLNVVGTATANAFTFVPATREVTVVTGGTTTVIDGTNTEIFNLDGGDPTTIPGDTLNVTTFLPGLATLPSGVLGAPGGFPKVNYQNFEGVIVSQVPTAVPDVGGADFANPIEDTPAIIDVIANDLTRDDVPLTLAIVVQPLNGTVVINNNNTPNPTVTYTPNANYNGPDSFQYTLQDANGEPLAPTATLVSFDVQPVNDAPVLTFPNPVITPNTQTEDLPGLISGISVADPLDSPYIYTDAVTLTLSVLNGTLTAVGGGVVGNGTNTLVMDGTLAQVNAWVATLTYTSNLNYNGADTLTGVLNDNGNQGGGALTSTQTLPLTVVPVNDAPTVTAPANATAVEDVLSPIAGVSVADLDSTNPVVTSFNVTVTVSATSGSLFVTPSNGVTVTANGGSNLSITGSIAQVNATLATLAYLGNLNFNGADSIVVTVDDLGNIGGGNLLASATIALDVTAVNDAPVNTVPVSVTALEDVPQAIAGLSVNDVDVGAGNLTVTLSVLNGTLSGTGFTGNGSGVITITDTQANVNAALATVVYTSNLHYNGSDTLTMLTNDNGNTGAGGPLTDTDTVAITVVPVNDAPTVTAPANATAVEDVLSPIAGVSVADLDSTNPVVTSFNVTVTVSATSGSLFVTPSNGVTVTANGGSNLSITGSIAQVNATLATLAYLGNLNFNGADSIVVTVDDLGNIGGGNLLASATIALDVTAVNDAPVNTVPGPLTTNEDTPLPVAGMSVADVDAGAGNMTVTLSVLNGTLTAIGAGVVGNGTATVVMDGTLAQVNAWLATVVYTPNLHYSGSDTLTMVSNDNGNTGSGGPLTDTDTVAITVVAVADAPNLAVVSPATGSENVAIPVTITASLVDTDGSETLSITILGVPLDAVFNQGTNVGDGSWTFTAAQLAGLTITVPDGPATLILTVIATATESSNGSSAETIRTLQVNVTNSVPTAALTNGGPVNEGSTGSVRFTTQTDPSQVDIVAGFHYAYDFNNDGVFDIGNGSYAGSVESESWVVPASFLADGPGTRTVRARIIDKDNGFTDYTTTITITNVAPTATPEVAGFLVERQPVTVSLVNPQDPSGPDVTAGFTYSWDLNNDGVFEVNTGSVNNYTFIPPIEGIYPVVGRITDKDGGFTDYHFVAGVQVQGQQPGIVVQDVDFFAVGAGNTGGPAVIVYNEDGSSRANFFAYEPSFTGGVQVAVGDVTGDQVPDIITGTGVGGGPVVKVWDGVTHALLASFFAYEESFRGGVQVSVGDVDGDGIGDIVTGTGVGGGPVVKAFRGGLGNGLSLLTSFAAYDINVRSGVNVAAGDLDGDGRAEIITGAGAGVAPHVKAFNTLNNSQILSFFAYEQDFLGGVFVAAGNLNGGLQNQIVTGPGIGGGPVVKVFNQFGALERSAFAFGPSSITGESLRNGFTVATADLNNDGRDDVIAGPGAGFGPLVQLLNGNSLGNIGSVQPFDDEFLGAVYVG